MINVIHAKEVILAFLQKKPGKRSPASRRRGGRSQVSTELRRGEIDRVGLLGYGHFPMALWVGYDTIALTEYGYSPTTTKHLSWLRREAASCRIKMYVLDHAQIKNLWDRPGDAITLKPDLDLETALDMTERFMKSNNERKLIEAFKYFREKVKLRKVIKACK